MEQTTLLSRHSTNFLTNRNIQDYLPINYLQINANLILTKKDKEDLFKILDTIYEITNVHPSAYMHTKSKKNGEVKLRQISAYCMRTFTSLSLREIGIIQGFRDHSTVIHSCKTVESWLDGTPGFEHEKKLVEQIIQKYGEEC